MIIKQKLVYCRPALCSGCRICANACAVAHDGVANPRLGRIAIHQNLFERYEFQELCRHCQDAPCVDACMVGCVEKDDETGIVTNDDRCVGCWMCVMVCPYGGMKRDLIRQVAIKCDLCKDLSRPVCVDVCPTGALVYEEKEDARSEVQGSKVQGSTNPEP